MSKAVSINSTGRVVMTQVINPDGTMAKDVRTCPNKFRQTADGTGCMRTEADITKASTAEHDRANASRWAQAALDKIVSAARDAVEARKLTALDAATYVLGVPGVAHLAEQYSKHSGKTLTPGALARLVVDASTPQSKPSESAAAKTLRSLKALDAAAQDAILSVGASRIYDAYNRAADAIRAGKMTADEAIAVVKTAARSAR